MKCEIKFCQEMSRFPVPLQQPGQEEHSFRVGNVAMSQWKYHLAEIITNIVIHNFVKGNQILLSLALILMQTILTKFFVEIFCYIDFFL